MLGERGVDIMSRCVDCGYFLVCENVDKNKRECEEYKKAMDDDLDCFGEPELEILYTSGSGNDFEVEYPKWFDIDD